VEAKKNAELYKSAEHALDRAVIAFEMLSIEQLIR